MLHYKMWLIKLHYFEMKIMMQCCLILIEQAPCSELIFSLLPKLRSLQVHVINTDKKKWWQCQNRCHILWQWYIYEYNSIIQKKLKHNACFCVCVCYRIQCLQKKVIAFYNKLLCCFLLYTLIWQFRFFLARSER